MAVRGTGVRVLIHASIWIILGFAVGITLAHHNYVAAAFSLAALGAWWFYNTRPLMGPHPCVVCGRTDDTLSMGMMAEMLNLPPRQSRFELRMPTAVAMLGPWYCSAHLQEALTAYLRAAADGDDPQVGR